MEGIGSEVSHKIRAAIKAKLIELGAYVDDELPDYIMVMVANKRTRAQMDEDLQLFLSSNTKIFTSWLHTVLQKLQEVTVANFENKKESENKKSSKSKGDDGKSRKSSEEPSEKSKKHSKKHKDSKKAKKAKHKTKEKSKEKKVDESNTSQDKSKNIELNEVVGRAILGDLKKSRQHKSESSSELSSSSENELQLNKKSEKENDRAEEDKEEAKTRTETIGKSTGTNLDSKEKNKAKVIEDEFNIEPLKPSEENDNVLESKPSENKEVQVEKTISAPTKELLKKHDKIQNEQFENEGGQTKSEDSDKSLSPEVIRKQLLLSRAKKKLEESKKQERMRSNSPDVLIVEETSAGKQLDFFSSKQEETRSSGSPRRLKRSPYTDRRSQSSERSSNRKGDVVDGRSKKTERKISSSERWKSRERDEGSGRENEKKKNVIKISESLELEKNLGRRKDSEGKTKVKKKPIPSRVVTITGPEAPEIPSIVKVKPREFISKDKQANKNLILKAVADAEKSIATIQSRREPDLNPEPKKEALYTKKLREKRFEKLAITLSNIRRSPDGRGGRRVSVDSEKSDKRLGDSSYDSGARGKSDNLSRKISKSEDQFISSKTSVMEKNDKYIRCWLEGVEKAVKDDEMVNPGEMDDFVHQLPSDDEMETSGTGKKRKSTEPSSEALTKAAKPNDEPQIVVTLDGLDSKAIKELIMKNKDSGGKPLLSSSGKNERVGSGTATGRVGPESRKSGFEKMSDRFGRLNKTGESEAGEPGKKKEKPKTTTESKNRQLIAQLSEKFGKVDREFESRKRKRTEDDRRCLLESRRNEKEDSERNGRYKKTERRNFREGQPQSSKYESDRYFHPKKCKFDSDCQNPKCEFVHSSENKPRWRSKA